MAEVQTAAGAIDSSELGFTLAHEHIFVGSLDVRLNWPQLFDREAEIAHAVRVLDEAYEAGVRTILDPTTVDLGRDVPAVAAVAKRTKLQIVVATGVHMEPPRYLRRRSPDRVVELYVHDIEQGVAGSGVRAGFLKIASEEAVTPDNEFHLRAIALAHRATGVPINTHSNPEAGTGADQQRIFAEEGVDLARVIIGHSGDTTNLDYLSGLMDRGSITGMDRFGTGMGATTEQRIETIAELCRRGYADRMVLSHDSSCHADNFPWELRASRLPEWNFLTISRRVLPELRANGVSDEQIEAMTVANPRRLFELQGAY